MEIIHIFPFHTDEEEEIEQTGYWTSDCTILRGIVCEKRSFDGSVKIYEDESIVEAETFYWHPLAQDTDIIQKGLGFVRNGLGFGKNTEKITKYLANNTVDTELPTKKKNKIEIPPHIQHSFLCVLISLFQSSFYIEYS